jgi:hypothetical protein
MMFRKGNDDYSEIHKWQKAASTLGLPTTEMQSARFTPLVKKIPAFYGNLTFITVIKNLGDWTPYPQQDAYSPHPRDISTFQIRNSHALLLINFKSPSANQCDSRNDGSLIPNGSSTDTSSISD